MVDDPLDVTAGILLRAGEVLVARRKPGKRMAGKWEFPGGKVEPGESPEACLQRELKEELGIDTEVGALLTTATHVYPFGAIRLSAYFVTYVGGRFVLKDHDAIAWVRPAVLLGYDLAEADRPLLEALRLHTKAPGGSGSASPGAVR